MKNFTTNIALIRQQPKQINFGQIMNRKYRLPFMLLFALIIAVLTSNGLFAQCSSSAPSVMAKWHFDSETVQCNGSIPRINLFNSVPILSQNKYFYCPGVNNGCGQALLGSKGFGNTTGYEYGLCLAGFWDNSGGIWQQAIGWDKNDLVFHPEIDGNIYTEYKFPVGKTGSITSFSLQVVQKQFDGTTINFEKQGVGVYRNGILIYNQTVPILLSNINATPFTFNFPNTPEFSTDGSSAVTYKIVFGLVHRLQKMRTGYDNICIIGTCGGSPSPSASILPATCGASSANADGKITISNFGSTDRYDFNTGSTYTGGKTYATATAIPAGGVITSTLPNPTAPQVYTVRIFTSAGCTTDLQVTLNPTSCSSSTCTAPTGTVAATPATCTGNSSNNNASIAVTGVSNGDRVGLSSGSVYAGALYGSAQALTAGAFTFSGLVNPVGGQIYTVRIFNGEDNCFKDYTVTLNETSCGCKKMAVEVISSDQSDPNSTPNNGSTAENDQATYEVCVGTQRIDLKLTKTVTPPNGTTCPTNTNFVWTLTLTNEGTMTATDIRVADALPSDLIPISASASTGSFSLVGGWLVPSLAAGTSTSLSITTKASKSGIYQNCAYVNGVFPLNDLDSSPLNTETANEDDDDCASITVTGPKAPYIEKEFSPALGKPNVPVRLTLKIYNTESTPINLTSDFVDNFPSLPAQMRIAATPNLSTSISGVIATANATNVTIPNGTVLLPGLNQIQVDVVGTAEGEYCNQILAGTLQTSSCNNLNDTSVCLTLMNSFILAPLIKKRFNPEIIQAGQNSTLTITIENRNSTGIMLLQDFLDKLPNNLTISGAASGSCPGISVFSGTTSVGITSGSVIPPGVCTIIVPVTSSISGNYCNQIFLNAMIGNVSNGSINVMTGNEDFSEACLTVTGTPCTTLDVTSLTPAMPTVAPGATVNLTVNGTGLGASTLYNWSGVGTFNPQTTTTTLTAPVTPGDYNIKVVADNKLTGYNACKDSITVVLRVQAACAISSVTAIPGACVPATNQYTVTGAVTFTGAPTTGTLTVQITGGGSQVFNAPFTSPLNYSIAGQPSDGALHTVTATFSANGTCTANTTYTAPAECAGAPVLCASALSAVPGACVPATNKYTLTGAVSFVDAPSSGTLTVQISGGGSQVFNAPFTSPLNYSIAGQPSDGVSHTVTATFSASSTCSSTTTYVAPAECAGAPVVCASSLSALPGACVPATNTYTLTGSVSFVDAPASGTLTVQITGGGSQVFNAPFTSPLNYSIAGQTSDGASKTVTATFSADPACTSTVNYTAPANCTPICAISSVTAIPGACVPATNQYTVTGAVTFTNAPTTGTLTVQITGGGSQVFNAPFTSPLNYSIASQPSDGALHTVTATFSANGTCTANTTYTAPAECAGAPVLCASALSAVPGACVPATNKYTLTGAVSFVDAPSSGTLTVQISGGGSQVFNAPFTSPLNYSIAGQPSDGVSHTVTATFSASSTCSSTTTYVAPAECAGAPVVCASSLSALPGACVPATNTYTLTGSVSFVDAPASGTLTVQITGGGSQVFNAPFTSPLNYSIAGQTSDGASHTVTATFSADNACTNTVNYMAPANCTPCAISSVTATSGACVPATNQYTVTGAVTFTNAPTTGTLTVQITGGGSQVFNAPFTSPTNYSIAGQTSDGASHTVTATFSAGNACTNTVNYMAPANCTPCAISNVTATPSACVPATNQYTVAGTITFTNAPTTGTLTVQITGGGSQVLNAPFTSPANYSIAGQTSDGASHTVTATFSADTNCTEVRMYNAPPACSGCPTGNCKTTTFVKN